MRIKSAFWDSSALLPLCYSQAFSAFANTERRKFPEIRAWWGTTVEIHSGISRLRREGIINDKQERFCLQRWLSLDRSIQAIAPSESLLDVAIELPSRYRLRAMDAFQLAAALVWCGERPRNRPFITADNRLGEAANDAGFEVVSIG